MEGQEKIEQKTEDIEDNLSTEEVLKAAEESFPDLGNPPPSAGKITIHEGPMSESADAETEDSISEEEKTESPEGQFEEAQDVKEGDTVKTLKITGLPIKPEELPKDILSLNVFANSWGAKGFMIDNIYVDAKNVLRVDFKQSIIQNIIDKASTVTLELGKASPEPEDSSPAEEIRAAIFDSNERVGSWLKKYNFFTAEAKEDIRRVLENFGVLIKYAPPDKKK